MHIQSGCKQYILNTAKAKPACTHPKCKSLTAPIVCKECHQKFCAALSANLYFYFLFRNSAILQNENGWYKKNKTKNKMNSHRLPSDHGCDEQSDSQGKLKSVICCLYCICRKWFLKKKELRICAFFYRHFLSYKHVHIYIYAWFFRCLL